METPKQKQSRRRTIGSPTFLSPSVNSNKYQKDEMVNLNNRMANYVEKVRSLEAENSTLKIQINNYEDNSTSRVDNLKKTYETEIKEARKLLDDEAKDKADLQLQVSSLKSAFDNLQKESDEVASSYSASKQELKSVYATLNNKETQLRNLLKNNEELKSSYNKLVSKHSELQKENESVKKTLQDEILMRVDFENKIQSLREDLQFKEKIYSQELHEARKVTNVSINEETFKAEYERRLEATIIDLRERHEQDVEILKEDLTDNFTEKIESLKSDLESTRSEYAKTLEKMTSSNVKTAKMNETILKLQAENNRLTNETNELQTEVKMEKQIREKSVKEAKEEREELCMTLKDLEKEYEELADIKVKLDGEIAVYRKLLEEEENRLKLTPSPMQEGPRTRARAKRKRKRVLVTQQTLEVNDEVSAKKQRTDLLHETSNAEEDNKCVIM